MLAYSVEIKSISTARSVQTAFRALSREASESTSPARNSNSYSLLRFRTEHKIAETVEMDLEQHLYKAVPVINAVFPAHHHDCAI